MILDRILEAKHEEVARARTRISAESLRSQASYSDARRGFASSLATGRGRRIIAEIKKASPSRGVIRDDFDPSRHARDYESAGAACISVLTDAPFFQGSLDHLRAVRSACNVPLLRKDFIVDAYQIPEAREAGADAILLIVAALEQEALADLRDAAVAEGLDVLVEVHDEAELETALAIGAGLIGINNRNLKTFETSTDVTRRLMSTIPASTTVISESGLGDPDELSDLERIGVSGFLIGETFMAAAKPGDALSSLLGG